MLCAIAVLTVQQQNVKNKSGFSTCKISTADRAEGAPTDSHWVVLVFHSHLSYSNSSWRLPLKLKGLNVHPEKLGAVERQTWPGTKSQAKQKTSSPAEMVSRSTNNCEAVAQETLVRSLPLF